MHCLNKGLNISSLSFSTSQAFLRVPRIPFVSFSLQLFRAQPSPGHWLLHDTIHIALHRLLIQSIESQSFGRRRARGTRLRDALDRVERMNKDAICTCWLTDPAVKN